MQKPQINNNHTKSPQQMNLFDRILDKTERTKTKKNEEGRKKIVKWIVDDTHLAAVGHVVFSEVRIEAREKEEDAWTGKNLL